jgi:hypothetical protein
MTPRWRPRGGPRVCVHVHECATQDAALMRDCGVPAWAQFNAALDRAEADLPKGAGSLLITSVGARAFSAGFDLSVMGNA